MILTEKSTSATCRVIFVVHNCCGCSCFVCADGHRSGYHTEPCQDRVASRMERNGPMERDIYRDHGGEA